MTEQHALIIEDSPTMRHLISFSLRRIPQLNLIEASHGAEALALLAQRQVDIILLDLHMPVMGGYTFLEQYSKLELTHRPPVVVITTEGDQNAIDRALELGAADYITKPVNAADMALTIEQVLKKARSQN